MRKTYRGTRDANVDGHGTVWVHEGEERRPLRLRLDLFNHSPGFAWGVSGPGSAQLALAILADALEDDVTALRLHQGFRLARIVGLDRQSWAMRESEVLVYAGASGFEAQSA